MYNLCVLMIKRCIKSPILNLQKRHMFALVSIVQFWLKLLLLLLLYKQNIFLDIIIV